MQCCPQTRRVLTIGCTLAVVAVIAGVVLYQNSVPTTPVIVAAEPMPTGANKLTDGKSWTLWGGSLSRNLVNLVDRNITQEWDAEEKTNILWTAALGSKAYGGPIIANGKIYMGTNNQKPRDPAIKGDKGVMMCFEERTGKYLWQIVFDKLPNGRVQDWPEEGICSAPVVKDDRIYFISNRCEVICATADEGKIVWKLDMIGKLGVFPHNLATCSPLIVGDTLFVITSNGVDEGHINIPKPEAPSFLALDIEKKLTEPKILWQSNAPSIKLIAEREKNPNVALKDLVDKGLVLMHGQWSNPVYAEVEGKGQIIFPGGDGWLYSFNPKNGELIWKFDCNPKASFYSLGGKGTRNDFVCTPVVADGKLYIGVGQDPEHLKGVGHLWCIDIAKTPKNAEKDLSPFSAADDPNPKFDPADPKNKDSGLVWHYGGDAPEGSPRRYLFGRTMSTCAVHDGLVYASEFDGWVHCFDSKTGKKHWDHDMKSDTWCSPSLVDGKVFIGNERGEVMVFAAGKEKKILATNEMPGTPSQVRGTPIAVNGVLYVLTENPCRMYAIQKK